MKTFYILFLFFLCSCQQNEVKEFATVEVIRGDVEIAVSLTGRAESAKQTSMMAPDDLTVEDLAVSMGQIVKTGDVICKLDTIKVLETVKQEETRIAQLESQIKSTKIRLNGLRRDLQRTLSLLKQGAASIEDKEKLEQELEILLSQDSVQEREKQNFITNLQKLKLQAELLNIKAPFDGVITYLWTPKDSFVKGSSVKKGDTLFRMSSEGKMIVKSTLREQDVNYFQTGQKIDLKSPAVPGLTIDGKVTHVDNAATIDKDSGVGSFRIYIEFTPATEIKSGMEMIAEVTVEKKENVLQIPKTAINPLSSDGYHVIVVDGETKSKKQIKVGLVGDSEIEVISGLTPGQKVLAQYEE
jgi:RND family efflux transporter MFP subunit